MKENGLEENLRLYTRVEAMLLRQKIAKIILDNSPLHSNKITLFEVISWVTTLGMH